MPGGQQQEQDNGLGPMWIIVGIFVFGAFTWYFLKVYIVAFVLGLRMYEADLMQLFVPSMWAHPLSEMQQYIHMAQQEGYTGVSFHDLIDVSMVIGDYLRYPAVIVLLSLSGLLYFTNPMGRYKRVHSMQTLLESEKENWPQVMPIVKLDLVNTDLTKGPWAMAWQPVGFARNHNLLIIEKPKQGASRFETKVPPRAKINRDQARSVFAMQLGRYWSGPEALPIHARALFAAFAARIAGDRERCASLLEQMCRSTQGGKVNYSGADDLLQKYKNHKLVKRITRAHAFELTVMPSLLEKARSDGVLASADFLWLKPVDRRLWFMLNSVGRQTPFCEVAGPYAHWYAEREFGRALNIPMIEEAVNGLEEAVKEFVFHPEEEDEEIIAETG
jgi:intracellular multiplication protein IcmP